MGTVEYSVLFSSRAIWVICLCVRVPKKILGTAFFPLLSLSLSLTFPPAFCVSARLAQAHREQGTGDYGQKKEKQNQPQLL